MLINSKLKSKRYIFCILVVVIVISCAKKRKVPQITITTYNAEALKYPGQTIDIPEIQKLRYKEDFFRPWYQDSHKLVQFLEDYPGKKISYLQNYLANDAWYGENKQPHSLKQREHLVANVDTTTFPNFLRKGIAIEHTNLRRLPTFKPGYDVYNKAGEGYPFDYFQETNIWANTPLHLLHLTEDKQWCYTVSPYYKGWIPMNSIAFVDDEFINNWTTPSFAFPIKDDIVLKNDKSTYAINAKIGMPLPFEENLNKNLINAFYTVSDQYKKAHILRASISKSDVAFDNFEFNAINLKGLVIELLDKPYGWGGQLENRDCSSMIRDMLSTYQVWLPRDSKDQLNVGEHFDLEGTREDKIKFIKENGIPFLTILRKKGHNMLYVGDDENGIPLIFHAIWGLKSFYTDAVLSEYIDQYPIEGLHQDENGHIRSRFIIGKSVITSVEAGSEYAEIVEPIIDEIYAMTNYLETESN